MSEYEKLVGEININGSHHNYVKRKVSQDTLFLLCLPNIQKDKLQSSENEYGSLANDFQKKGNDVPSSKKAPVYNQFHHSVAEYLLVAVVPEKHIHNVFVNKLFAQFSPLDNGRPPQVIS